MIFRNPAGAPELACDECGCRWFDRMTNACYECGEPMAEADTREYARAIAEWQARVGDRDAGAVAGDRASADSAPPGAHDAP
ncbi:MAG: hypothetical protein J0L91_07280 [Burkholderiales bacterium]|nr:hypothetical protein [Burkholderiales bacterium]MCC7115764.1 hypothetical protein [Burkholderiales bacterium]